MNRVYLERYKKCGSSEEIGKAQEEILEELEKDWKNSRNAQGAFSHAYFDI